MTNATKVPAYDAHCPDEPIRAQLRRQLLALGYHAFAQCLCLLLTRLGYEDAHVAGRTGWKGRNREGGYDIEAILPAGIGTWKVIVQVKQFDALPIFQRSIDELRGTCLRTGASEALLITTSTFSPVVRQKAVTIGTEIAPVRLLDGDGLIDLLLRHRIGVWEEAGTSPTAPRQLGIDHAFFEELSHQYAGTGRTPAPTDDRDMKYEDRKYYRGRKSPYWLVTVQVGSPGVFHSQQRRAGKEGK